MRHALAAAAGLACILAAPIVRADSAADYNQGYNAGFENTSPPDTSSTDDYFAGWNAGRGAAEAQANDAAPAPSDESGQ